MADNYRVRYRQGDVEIEVESSEKDYVDAKFQELLKLDSIELTAPVGGEVAAKQVIRAARKPRSATVKIPSATHDEDASVEVTAIIDAIHQAEKFPEIETNVLKKRDQLGRILLCFYFAYTQFNQAALSAKQVEEITDRLGNQIKDTNVSKTIRNKAKPYLTLVTLGGDTKMFKMNIRGKDAFEKILSNQKP
jgi:hypothetical protein